MSRLLFTCVASALLLAGCDNRVGPPKQQQDGYQDEKLDLTGEIDRSFAGQAMPSLEVLDDSGNMLALESLRGRPVLLNLWATWCAPCVAEMPTLDALALQMGDRLRVLTISQDIRGAEVVGPFFAKQDFKTLEQWLDEDAALSDALSGDGKMPLTILYDSQGREVFRVAGGFEWDSEEAIAEISEAIAE